MQKSINKSFHLILIIIFSVILISCSSQKRDTRIIEPFFGDDKYVIWVHSDIQPRDKKEWYHYELAVKDIRDNFRDVDMAIIAGDIIHYSRTPHVYEWFLRTRNELSIKYWYEIAGNHEAKDYANYDRYINKPLCYSVRVGNILILLMSDEKNSPPQDISDDTYVWWKNYVINNQNCIIITVTHAYLEQSNLFGSWISSRNIIGSGRFADVLKQYKVDVWIAGHTHWPNYLPGNAKVSEELNNTLFVNVAAIRKDIINYVASRIFIFTKGSGNLLIRNRNHEKNSYDEWLDINHPLSHKFIWDGSPPSQIEGRNTVLN
ncbi:MAG: metallophosphoesterase [Spirochaetota bacterium]|nr:metallophosphoesterase [Spirochaetota bacterium]